MTATVSAASGVERVVALTTTVLSAIAVTLATVIGFVSDVLDKIPVSFFVHMETGQPRLRFWTIVLVLLILVAIMALGTLYIRLAIKLGTSHSRRKLELRAAELEIEIQGLGKAYDDVVRATGDVFENWKSNAGVMWRYTKVDERYEIHADGTTLATWTYTIEAVKQTSVFRVKVFSDDSATPCPMPKDIKFHAFALDADGEEIRYIPILNTPRHKEFALFFMPPIEPGQTRRFRVTHNWPLYAADLLTKDHTVFAIDYSTCETTDRADVEMEFAFAKTLGEIEFKKMDGFDDDGGSLDRRDHMRDEWRHAIWTYKNADLLMHGRRLRFSARRGSAQPAPPPG